MNLSSSILCFGLTDVGDIQSRLLDHRPVVNAEIRYFVKEFEVLKEKKKLREMLSHWNCMLKTLFFPPSMLINL